MQPIGTPGPPARSPGPLRAPVQRLSLEGSDTLLLHTRSASEAEGLLGLPGPDGLAAELGASARLNLDELLERIECAAEERAPSSPREDLALVALRVAEGAR